MKLELSLGALVSLALLASGCGGASASTSASTGPTGPTAMSAVYLEDTGDSSAYLEGSSSPGSMRLKPALCDGMKELRPEYKILTEDALIEFLQAQGYESKKTRARSDLVYVNATKDGVTTMLRVAILPTAQDAGRDLHEAILEHGKGSWGVHRSNLAVLAPIGSPSEIVAFAGKSKLACWGVLTLAGRDDSFVVPGGYTEL